MTKKKEKITDDSIEEFFSGFLHMMMVLCPFFLLMIIIKEFEKKYLKE